MTTPDRPHVPQTARGHRPTFLNDPANDRIIAMLMSLVTEVAVLRDRLDTVEAIAARKGVMLAQEIETFEPDPARAAAREAWRQEYLGRILYVFQEETEDLARGDTPEAYRAAVNISAES
jgi:hypothetical protein